MAKHWKNKTEVCFAVIELTLSSCQTVYATQPNVSPPAWCSTQMSLKSICKIMASKFGMSDAACILGLHCFVCVYTLAWEKRKNILGMPECIHPNWLTFSIQFFFFILKIIYCMYVSVCLCVCACLSVQFCGCVSECACVCVYACCLGAAGVCVGVCVCGKRKGKGGGSPSFRTNHNRTQLFR